MVGSRQKACIHSLNHRKDEFRHTQHRQDYVVFPPPEILHFSLSPVFSPIPQSIGLQLSYPTWSRVYSLLHAHTCLLGCINVPTNVPILAHQPNHQASPAPTLSSTPQSHPALQPLQPACNSTCQQPHPQPGPTWPCQLLCGTGPSCLQHHKNAGQLPPNCLQQAASLLIMNVPTRRAMPSLLARRTTRRFGLLGLQMCGCECSAISSIPPPPPLLFSPSSLHFL